MGLAEKVMAAVAAMGISAGANAATITPKAQWSLNRGGIGVAAQDDGTDVGYFDVGTIAKYDSNGNSLGGLGSIGNGPLGYSTLTLLTEGNSTGTQTYIDNGKGILSTSLPSPLDIAVAGDKIYSANGSTTITIADALNGSTLGTISASAIFPGGVVGIGANEDGQYTITDGGNKVNIGTFTPNGLAFGTNQTYDVQSGDILLGAGMNRDTIYLNDGQSTAMSLDNPIAVPAPSALGMGALGLGLIAARRRGK